MQTTFSQTISIGLVGQIIDDSPHDMLSAVSTTTVKYGTPVVRDNAANASLIKCKQAGAAAAGGLLLGIAVRNDIQQLGSVVQANTNAGTPVVNTWADSDTYQIGTIVPIIRYGRVYISCRAITGTPTLGTAKAYYVWATGIFNISNAVVASSTDCGFLTTADATGSFTAGGLYALQVINQTN